jgi:hypothetical protein
MRQQTSTNMVCVMLHMSQNMSSYILDIMFTACQKPHNFGQLRDAYSGAEGVTHEMLAESGVSVN